MKRKWSSCYMIMGLSLLCVAVPGLGCIIKTGSLPDFFQATLSLIAASTVLLFLPTSSQEDFKEPSIAAAFTSFAYIILSSLCVDMKVVVLGLLVLLFLDNIYRSVFSHLQLTALFKSMALWYMVENYSRIFYIFAQSLVTMLFLVSHQHLALRYAAAILTIALYTILMIRFFSGTTMLLSRKQESALKAAIKIEMLCEREVTEEECTDNQHKQLFQQCTLYMRKFRPFLKEDYSLDDFARDMLTNRTYISRILNESGINFRQFVNSFRVEYAKELIEKELSIRMVDLAALSGFSNTATLNNAFKLHNKVTPGEYRSRLLGQRLQE